MCCGYRKEIETMIADQETGEKQTHAESADGADPEAEKDQDEMKETDDTVEKLRDLMVTEGDMTRTEETKEIMIVKETDREIGGGVEADSLAFSSLLNDLTIGTFCAMFFGCARQRFATRNANKFILL